MIPTISVNLNPCNCGHVAWLSGRCNGMVKHSDTCASAPILIPCRLPPSFTCSVALGECRFPCTALSQYDTLGSYGVHHANCPARPVRVSASISGKTWEDSTLGEFELEPSGISPNDALRDACRARWALAMALVLGASKVSEFPEPFRMVPAVSEMLVRRDTVYAALADMVRGQAAYAAGNERLPDFCRLFYRGDPTAEALDRYVEHLIEQVGVLS